MNRRLRVRERCLDARRGDGRAVQPRLREGFAARVQQDGHERVVGLLAAAQHHGGLAVVQAHEGAGRAQAHGTHQCVADFVALAAEG